MFKVQILAALKVKYPGMSNELLGLLADKLSAKITEEDKVQAGVDELDNLPIPVSEFAAFLQKESDRRVTEATKTHEKTLREKYDFKDKGGAGDPEKKPGEGDDLQTKLFQQVTALANKLEEMEKKEKRQGLQDSFIKKLTEKKIPVSFARGRIIESEDQIDTMLAEAETEYTELKQSLINEELGEAKAPIGGTPGSKGKNKPATEKELEAVLDNLKI